MKLNRDSELAQAVHLDRGGAVEELVDAYQDRLYGYALRLLQNSFDAQEVTQDALLRAYRSLAFTYDDAKCRSLALGPWLFRITRNLVFNRLRARRSRGEEALMPLSDERAAGLHYLSDPALKLQSQERRALLERALGCLGAESRDLVQLRFVEGMTYAQVAAVTGITESAARAKVFRALRRLRAILVQEGYDGV